MTDTVPKRHKRGGLFAPFIILLLVLAGWTGWWVYLTGQVKERIDLQAEALRQSGWSVAYVHGGMSGWPFRTRLELDDLKITAPSGHAVAALLLVAQANAWNPDKWVIVAEDGLTLTRAGKGEVGIKGAAIRASVHGLTQPWPNVAVEFAKPVFAVPFGAEPFPISKAEKVEFYLRPHRVIAGTEGSEGGIDVLFRLIDAEGRQGGPVQGMTNNGKLTAQIETVIEDADRLSGQDAAGVFAAWTRAGGRFVHVRGELAAGDSRATLSSDALSAQADGRLQGQLALSAERPGSAMAGLGPVGAAAAATVPGGDATKSELVLVFQNGQTFLGPFILAPAPKLF